MHKIASGIVSAILLLLLCTPCLLFAGEKKWDEKKFTRQECRWAVKWINGELPFFMANGILKKIIAKKKVFEIWTGEGWNELKFEQKGAFLANMSRAREITGHRPFFRVIDNVNKNTVARVADRFIEINLPGEGLFKYIIPDRAKKNTFY